jgi:lysophospholipase L1-like esterase
MARRMTLRCLPSLVALLCSIILVTLPLQSSLAASSHSSTPALVGPKARYLALGDSLAFGYQPDLNYVHGYANYLYTALQQHGTSHYTNMGCPGETSTTMITGQCPYPFLRKYPYTGSQLAAAVSYLRQYAGTVSPVTLDIGANDLIPDVNTSTCTISTKWTSDLATVDYNLTHTILPQLSAALTSNGQRTGDLLIMNYYDPFENVCPASLPYIQAFNQHIAADISGYATLVDVYDAFGTSTAPNPNLCNYTWMCSVFKDIHATDKGYSIIANAFAQTVDY